MPFVRRITPVILSGLITASLILSASASVPEKRYTSATRELRSIFDSQPFSAEELKRQLTPMLDPHPFSNEFYLREFATETPESHRQHSKLAPMFTGAASSLSKKVASLRRALARMMP